MSKVLAFAVGGSLIYLAAAIALVVWYVIHPVEQIMWLGFISFPADLLFFWLGSGGWPVLLQAFAIAVCGVVQYGALGALIGSMFRSTSVTGL